MRAKALSSVFVATVLFATAMFGLAASSAGATGIMTITVGTPTVTNKLLVTVPVQVVCDAQNGDPTEMDLVHVDLSQANGKTVTTGSGQVAGGPGDFFTNNVGPFLTCDGKTVNNVAVTVLGNGQYKGGGAIITVNASQSVGTGCSFGCVTASESATVGPTGIKLHG
jgi:hypothetical protein